MEVSPQPLEMLSFVFLGLYCTENNFFFNYSYKVLLDLGNKEE